VRRDDHLWGTGVRGKKKDLQTSACQGYGKFNNITVYSARGPKTIDLLQDNCVEKIQTYGDQGYTKNLSGISPIGDTTFLVPFVFPELRLLHSQQQHQEQQSKKNSSSTLLLESCVILQDGERSSLNATLLPLRLSWQALAGNITQCKLVSSSSLQGLILADAHGVPSRWIRPSSKTILSFEFEDYFESIGHSKTALDLDDVLSSTNSLLQVPQRIDADSRSAYAKKIMDSFPFHLFRTKAT
jgi:hypothetical protein